MCKGFADDMQTEEAKESALLNSKGQLAELRAAMSRHLWESSNDIYDIFKLCWAAREPRRVSPHSIFPRLVRERNNEY